ncbi:hypothetical protein [Mesorhizobium caraganae]|uniref:hypothetical protein n=1 Tax=Mesorhizobium caraganae TaxID=483206 RepID=UPI0028A00EE1|nr:hypothetical protein [Mesorhizobium caraganae]
MKSRSRPTPGPTIETEVPWADHLTAYDNKHLMLYSKLIDACADSASEEEMARDILGIDPVKGEGANPRPQGSSQSPGTGALVYE